MHARNYRCEVKRVISSEWWDPGWLLHWPEEQVNVGRVPRGWCLWGLLVRVSLACVLVFTAVQGNLASHVLFRSYKRSFNIQGRSKYQWHGNSNKTKVSQNICFLLFLRICPLFLYTTSKFMFTSLSHLNYYNSILDVLLGPAAYFLIYSPQGRAT